MKDETRAQGYRNAGEKARSVILSLKAEIYITDQLAGVERKPLSAGYTFVRSCGRNQVRSDTTVGRRGYLTLENWNSRCQLGRRTNFINEKLA